MRLNQIQHFVAIMEAGSIHAAARKLGVSQPALTKSLKNLEAGLHLQLLRRTNHGIVPTPAGKAFFARAQLAHTELRKAEEEMLQLAGASGGSVAFGVGPTAAVLVVPEAIVQFRKQHPRIPVRIVEGYANAVLPLVRDGSLDFAVAPRTAGAIDPAFEFRPILHSRAIVVVRKGHPLANARSLAQLKDADWLHLFSAGGSPGLEEAFSSAGLSPPRAIIQCESYNLLTALLERTDMVGTCSHRHLTSPNARSTLQRVPIDPLATYTVGIVSRRDSPLTPVAAALARSITASARRLPAVQ